MKLKNEFIKETIIKKSRFITCLNRISNENDAKAYLQHIKKIYPNATHYCHGYIYNVNNPVQHSSDDGEPKQTAGVPILTALNNYNMQDTIAVVVRYFKGIKLGTGGLTRAYGNCVSEALKSADKVELISFKKYQLEIPYHLDAKINYYLRQHAERIECDYDLNVTYTFLSNHSKLPLDIQEITKGQYLVKYCQEEIIEKDL